MSGIRLVINTPAGIEHFSRGFYQIEEDILHVPIHPSGRFFSYLDAPAKDNRRIAADSIRIDIDRKGKLLFISILQARRNWRVRENLQPPLATIDADVRFLKFRDYIDPPVIECNAAGDVVHIVFDGADDEAVAAFRIADNIIFEISDESVLSGIWITEIIEDRAALAMGAWRKMMKESEE